MTKRKPVRQKEGGASYFKTLIFAVGVVLVWRGIWGFMDEYLFPGHPTLSYVLSFIFGLIILSLDDFDIDELRR